jgi:hypothetical protein
MTVIQFPGHKHTNGNGKKCFQCTFFAFLSREFPDADLVLLVLGHVLLQKMTFGHLAPPDEPA